MFVHGMSPVEESAHRTKAVVKGEGHDADGAVDAEAPADPLIVHGGGEETTECSKDYGILLRVYFDCAYQSQKAKTFAGSIPNLDVRSSAEEQAAMCWRATTTGSEPGRPSKSHCLMVRALSMVSAVVKVFDTTTTRVVAGSRPRVAR